MNAELRITSATPEQTVINLSIPSGKAKMVVDAICGMLPLAGLKVRQLNNKGEELLSITEVFPEANPAMVLRGFRGKKEWTQQELAEKLGTTQNSISEMESGKRSISKSMAERLGKVFSVPYKAFL